MTTGLMHAFTGGEGTSAARGTLQAGRPVSSIYAATITTSKKTDEVRLTITNGNVKDFKVDPPQDNDPERVPITEAHQRGVLDPMTASLLRTPGTGDPLSPEACQQTLAVFDGRLRYDLQLAFKRMDKVKADKGLCRPGGGLRGLFFADRRLHSVARRDQIHRQAARHRGLAGADRGHPRAGAVPRAGADADRSRRDGGHPIRLGRQPDPGLRQRDEDAVIAETKLDSLVALRPRTVVNVCARLKGGKICLGYSILWETAEARPDVAVNERIQAPSQRFGRVSFQTRSKA